MGNLFSLIQLKLSHNKIISIPPELGSLPQLLWLALANNPITSIPQSLRLKTDVAVISHPGTNKKESRVVESVVWAEMKGMRPSQEDTVVVNVNYLDSAKVALACVFDGHRGAEDANAK